MRTDIDGTFVKELAELARAPKVLEVDGVARLALPAAYTLQSLPEREPIPETLALGSLEGLAAYAKNNRDGLVLGQLLLKVADPTTVELLGPLAGHFRERATIATASLEHFGSEAFRFGHWHDMESFVIGLQAQFVNTPELAQVLRLVGNVKDEAVRATSDDGVSQSVVARQGAALVAEVPVPNPVTLAPYRTFREVEQPASRFVLRLRSGGPLCALFEADGGAWRLEAVSRVAAWLREALKGTDLVVIA